MDVQRMQESRYTEDVDYRVGSPHLAHWQLYDRLVGVVRAELARARVSGRVVRVLEIGAGHGGYTEPALAQGCAVTAVEMSRPSLRVLRERYGSNDRFRAVLDTDGSLEAIAPGFDVVLAVSVLHHVPDYVSLLRAAAGKLVPGGALVTLQDPLFYPRVNAWVHRLDRMSYLLWRLGYGHFLRGLSTALRRARGIYDDDKPGDTVEYHVVRRGVDEDAVVGAMKECFAQVRIETYWSNQFAPAQWLGERLSFNNTFAVIAHNLLSSDSDVQPARAAVPAPRMM